MVTFFTGGWYQSTPALKPNPFKWKIAFLYSNEGFIPIYKKDALKIIAIKLGLKIKGNTKYSEIHRSISRSKPSGGRC